MNRLATAETLDVRFREVFGSPDEPLEAVERRARAAFPDDAWMLWEGDASTFQFSYVSPSAVEILGYPVERWTTEPTFWTDVVVDPVDRDEAVAFCAMATGLGRDHEFRYRARAADGRTVHLHDAVQVVFGPRGVPQRLRGIMVVADSEAGEV
jgi:PAS domain-containing protein